MKVALRLGVVLVAACVLASAASGASSSLRDVAFVTMSGKGTVRSVPRGIACPKTCRAAFARGTHLRLVAAAAPGWRFAGYASRWCNGARSSCVFDLVSEHDCVGGACPTGAFGVRAAFVRAD